MVKSRLSHSSQLYVILTARGSISGLIPFFSHGTAIQGTVHLVNSDFPKLNSQDANYSGEEAKQLLCTNLFPGHK